MNGLKKKSSQSIVLIASLLAFMAMYFHGNAQQPDRNSVLISRVLTSHKKPVPPQAEYAKLLRMKTKKITQVRLLEEEDPAGAFQTMYEFDPAGNLVSVVNAADQSSQTFHYNRGGDLRKISTFQKGTVTGHIFYYYNEKGLLTKSVESDFFQNMEKETRYDEFANPVKFTKYKNWTLTSSVTSKNSYDEKGRLTKMETEGTVMEYTYDASGRIAELSHTKDGKTSTMAFGWDKDNLATVTTSKGKDGVMEKFATLTFTYNAVDLISNETVAYEDKTTMPESRNYRYDNYSEELTSLHRGDMEDDASMGYGTPIIITWKAPTLEETTMEESIDMHIEIRPGPGQEMPVVDDLILRHNGKLTHQKVGKLYLEQVGKSNLWEIKKRVFLQEGYNTLELTVQTPLGEFHSAERFVRYRNPKARIAANNLHLLSIGIGDYALDSVGLPYADGDAMDLAMAFASQEGALYKKVNTEMLLNEAATKSGIEMSLRKLRTSAPEDDLVVLFFSGYSESIDGEVYLKPHFAESGEGLKNSGIPMTWMMEEVERFRCPVVILMDASRGGPAGSQLGTGIANMEEAAGTFSQVLDSDEDLRILLTSTSGVAKSYADKQWNNSAFAEAVIAGLEGEADEAGNKDGIVSMNELESFLKDSLAEMTDGKQVPVMSQRGVGLIPLAKTSN